MGQGPSGIMRTSTYVLQHLVHHGSSLQKLALASSAINPSIDPGTTILCRFKTTRMTKSHWFARFLSCSNISINCLSFHVQFMSFSFRFVSCVEQIPKSKNNKRNKVVLLQNLHLRKGLIKASSQWGKKVLHRSPKTWQVVSEGVVIINKLFQLWGGSRVYFHCLHFNSFPLMSIHPFSVPFMSFTFPCHFLFMSFHVIFSWKIPQLKATLFLRTNTLVLAVILKHWNSKYLKKNICIYVVCPTTRQYVISLLHHFVWFIFPKKWWVVVKG